MVHAIPNGATEIQQWDLCLDEDVDCYANVEPCPHARDVRPADDSLGKIGYRTWRLRGFVAARNEGGYNSTEVCLDCILEAARTYA